MRDMAHKLVGKLEVKILIQQFIVRVTKILQQDHSKPQREKLIISKQFGDLYLMVRLLLWKPMMKMKAVIPEAALVVVPQRIT
jgi:hypothetical protein